MHQNSGNAVIHSDAGIVWQTNTGSAAVICPCPVGTYIEGFYRAITGFQCSPCLAGTWSNLTGPSACAACAVGAYGPTQGATACLPCTNGTYSPAAGATACPIWPVAAGAGIDSFCQPGSRVLWAKNVYVCTPCPVGAFCPDGAPTPLVCPAGFYCPSIGLTFPVGCPAHAFCDQAGMSMFTPCPAGNPSSYQMVAAPPGSVSAAQCQTATVTVSTLAGNGNLALVDGTGSQVSFWNPSGLALDPSGNLIVSDANGNRIRRMSPNGGTHHVGHTAFSLAFDVP